MVVWIFVMQRFKEIFEWLGNSGRWRRESIKWQLVALESSNVKVLDVDTRHDARIETRKMIKTVSSCIINYHNLWLMLTGLRHWRSEKITKRYSKIKERQKTEPHSHHQRPGFTDVRWKVSPELTPLIPEGCYISGAVGVARLSSWVPTRGKAKNWVKNWRKI